MSTGKNERTTLILLTFTLIFLALTALACGNEAETALTADEAAGMVEEKWDQGIALSNLQLEDAIFHDADCRTLRFDENLASWVVRCRIPFEDMNQETMYLEPDLLLGDSSGEISSTDSIRITDENGKQVFP